MLSGYTCTWHLVLGSGTTLVRSANVKQLLHLQDASTDDALSASCISWLNLKLKTEQTETSMKTLAVAARRS